ncbi:dihydrofolate reductase [Aspergillus costaricaensis CBS 115574]|uniref:Dihydrofolate reductase n=1 Tax=Aspergillus costaricaensis CBS 115574 TaxID=1448317 RepID=A0ACD1IQ29_9EURO|nr:dihydrofolate reductase [Aspergillus costaricaensis CBS 115574]RAK92598.1 dihydrofolate reductase [Aspergillus costaricaensis CBS 115574]
MPPLKLLCLHGYTQSGPLFHAKSRAVIKHLTKTLLPTTGYTITTTYPTGPIHLLPSDIPGYEPSTTQGGSTTTSDDTPTEAYGWFRRSSTANPPLYTDLHLGLETIANVIKTEGPFDGVVGFSQGAAMAAIVAALLEPGREEVMDKFVREGSVFEENGENVKGFEVPSVWWECVRSVGQGQLKFAVCYSGFRAPGPRYSGFYEGGVKTPVLHVLGSLDAVVDEGRSRALVEVTDAVDVEGRVVVHPGGHFVPAQRPYLDAVVGFVRGVLGDGGNGGKKEKEEVDVNEMELPF